MRLGRKETLKEFTERAIDATFRGTLIPPIVYIPQRLRKNAARVRHDGAVTLNPASSDEVDFRIAQADPTSFLIAIMQGQPIPQIVLVPEGKELRASVEFLSPALPERLRAAEILTKVRTRLKPGDAGYDAMIARASEA